MTTRLRPERLDAYVERRVHVPAAGKNGGTFPVGIQTQVAPAGNHFRLLVVTAREEKLVLEQTQDEQEIIARVAAFAIGKAELVCCVRVPDPAGGSRRVQEVTTYCLVTALVKSADEGGHRRGQCGDDEQDSGEVHGKRTTVVHRHADDHQESDDRSQRPSSHSPQPGDDE